MPTYEYACLKCGAAFELFQSMKDAPIDYIVLGQLDPWRRGARVPSRGQLMKDPGKPGKPK